MPNYNKIYNQYADLSENKMSSKERKFKAEVLRRVKALKVDWIKEVRFGHYDNDFKNIWEYIKNVPAIVRDPVPKLQSQAAERIGDRDSLFFEYQSEAILEALIDNLSPDQILYLCSGDEFIADNGIPTGRPAFLVVPNGEGFLFGEHWKAHQGKEYEVQDTMSKEEIIAKLSENLDGEYWKRQIMILEKPKASNNSKIEDSLNSIRKDLVLAEK